ncbi:MAG: hypothetical protein HQ521_20120 [Bacteroidetes bacterium]|nr:hypothetical protein [Bacteroidota bacterium]
MKLYLTQISVIILISILLFSCQKEDSLSHSGTKQYMARSDSAVDNNRPGIDGVWRTTKQWTSESFILWFTWDVNMYPAGCYLLDMNTMDTAARWVFEVNDLGQITKTTNSEDYYKEYGYDPITHKLVSMSTSGGSPIEYFWNNTLDTVWSGLISENTWLEVDSNNNILTQAGNGNVQTFTQYEHPNSHVHYAPTSFFEGPTSNYNILDEQYNSSGNLIRFATVDSAVDGRVYRYTLDGTLTFHFEWTFLTYDAR